jgi:hypothetical protein
MALGAILGSAVAALCCFGLFAAPDGAAAHADEALPQAMSGVSAAASQLVIGLPVANGAHAAGQVPAAPTTTTTIPVPTTTTTTPPPPPMTTTPSPVRPTLTAPVFPTFTRPFPTPPHMPVPTTGKHHCRGPIC